jgi:hypothetical protein
VLFRSRTLVRREEWRKILCEATIKVSGAGPCKPDFELAGIEIHLFGDHDRLHGTDPLTDVGVLCNERTHLNRSERRLPACRPSHGRQKALTFPESGRPFRLCGKGSPEPRPLVGAFSCPEQTPALPRFFPAPSANEQ